MIVAISSNLFSQNEWQPQISGTTNFLAGMQFIDINTGYIVGGIFSSYTSAGIILKTTNSGQRWVIQKTTYSSLRNVFFINANTGWAVGGYTPEYGTVYRFLIKTVDGGQNWVVLINDSQSPRPLSSLFFIDSLTGFVGSSNGGVLKTIDGGYNFTTVIPPGGAVSHVIRFLDNNTGFFGGQPYIYITTNAGDNWALNYYSNVSSISDLFFTGKNYGYGVGYGTIIKTSNGGNNWERLINQDYTFRRCVFFIDSLTGYVAYTDFNKLMKTTNGGTNWVDRYIQNGTYIGSVYFVNKNTGWVCGAYGTIFKTTTGGEPSGVINIDNKIPSKYSLSQNYPNPFNPKTAIRFQVAGNSIVLIKIFDVNGREVQTLVNERLQAGTYETTFDGSGLNSGVYFYKLITDGFTETKKMLMIK